MPTKTSGMQSQRKVFELLRGGRIPEAFLRRRIAQVKETMAARFQEKEAVDKQYARYWSQIYKTPKSDPSPRVTHAIDGLLGMHKKLARKKLVAPSVLGDIGGVLPGRFGATITPPFDYAFTIPFLNYGNPSLTGSAN